MRFLEFIFWTIVVVWFVGWLVRVAFGWLLRNNAQTFARSQRPSQRKKEGDVTVEGGAMEDKKVKKDVGEYVDFEEIKE